MWWGGGLGEEGIYKLIRNFGVGIKVLTVVLVCPPLVIALLNWNSWVNSPWLFQWWLFSPVKKLQMASLKQYCLTQVAQFFHLRVRGWGRERERSSLPHLSPSLLRRESLLAN